MRKYPTSIAFTFLLFAAHQPAVPQQPAGQADLLDATCGQYLQAARAADPGRNPSARRRAEAEEAQDALVDAMLWLHGYRTGVGGAQAAAQPLTGEWIADQARRLAEYCRANSQDGNMPLVDAARRL